MRVTSVKMFATDIEGSRMKAKCSVTLDNCIAIHSIRVIEGDKGLFIAMPSVKKEDGTYSDIVHPINTETRLEIQDAILDEYKKSLNN